MVEAMIANITTPMGFVAISACVGGVGFFFYQLFRSGWNK